MLNVNFIRKSDCSEPVHIKQKIQKLPHCSIPHILKESFMQLVLHFHYTNLFEREVLVFHSTGAESSKLKCKCGSMSEQTDIKTLFKKFSRVISL